MGDCMRHTARVLIIGEVSATLKEVIDDIEGGNVSKVIAVDKGDGVDGEMKRNYTDSVNYRHLSIEQRRPTPSYVAFTDSEPLIGDVAMNPTNIVFDGCLLLYLSGIVVPGIVLSIVKDLTLGRGVVAEICEEDDEDVSVALTDILKLPLMDKSNGCSFSSISSIAVFSSAVFVVSLILVRLLYVLYCSSKPLSKRASKPFSTLIILGSGGHTAEMLNLLAVLQKGRFNPRFYIAAATDNMSLQKAQLLENSLAAENATRVTDTAQFMKIYRSREVGQSYITSVWTTFVAMVHALWLMIKIRPEVILCNGPGTCIPLCAIAFIFKVLGIRWSLIFYVESIARVRRLSLRGLLLYKLRMADKLFVQWPQLQRQYPRATYAGRLM
ncbi:UDP-N-acetylglucosamine transferase subunit ALG14 [Glycine soja]